MRLRDAAFGLACATVLAASAARAAVEPAPGGGDPRLRVVAFDPLQVVALKAVLGYQMMIVFDPAERIENVAIGDSLGWQVVPSRRSNLLFLKPMERGRPTNMTVVTNLRSYSFALSVAAEVPSPDDPDLIYTVRFEYPAPVFPVVEAPPEAPKEPQDVNHAYSYEGSILNLPVRIFDDGHSTYFRFASDASYPAIFAVDADRSESVVNFQVRDGYVVVDRLAPGFVLRRGKVETRIFDDGYREPGPSPISPHARRKAHWWP